MNATTQKSFLKEYTRAVRDGAAALFVGAGISHAAGFVDWKQLMAEIADELDLSIDRETDLVSLAQYHVNRRGGRDRLHQLMIDEFLEHVGETENHRLIATLPVDTVWTTNYDDLLERAFEGAGKRVDVKRRAEDFAATRRRSDVTIFKMHGDRTAPADAVITREDYETYHEKRQIFSIALKGDLATRTFLFLGFSFADPNVLQILSRVRQLLDKNSRQHFCVLRPPDPGHDGYERKRFDLWLEDLRRYNIQPVLVDDYGDITKLLAELNRRSHLRDVFVSGSAADFEPLGEEVFYDLSRKLGEQMIGNGFNLISGFGLGVGSPVVVGALSRLPRNDDQRLQLWPFPQQVSADVDRATLWREYRERMIAGAGALVVLSGNKLVDRRPTPASGVREEVQIARSQGKPVVPVGISGYVARELWEEIADDPTKEFGEADVTGPLEVLGNSGAGVDAWVKAVIDILKQLDR